jgi:AcrR family transcriptional regulator
VLAKSLGVTKGSFYGRFKDRAALLSAMLADWSAGRIAAVQQQATTLDSESARARLKALIRLYSQRTNTEDVAIELAIRQWAREDQAAAAAVAGVDAARLKNVAHLYRATGLASDEAGALAFLFYCFVLGRSVLFLDSDQRKHEHLVVLSTEKLLDEES